MISKKSYGVDVAKYQPESLRVYAKAGAKYAIVQVSVSNSIVAPRAKAQITSAKANNIMPMGYFYGCFGHSATQAASEAHFAIKNAKSIGLPKGSYLGVDWERTDNNVNGNVSQNTAAIIQAMKVIRDAGYIPLLYSGADLLRNKINTKQIIKQFGTCLW
ncbi:MAG: GH25 family lysozyme, partial [Lactobacillus crispatus]|nr:GH25 family lysozyme [Lactobacillus crispatus]